MEHSYTRLRFACYSTNVTMSIIGNLSPLLFLTFRSLYGISYSLLGLLVLINFVTQLGIDLLFSFFSHKFNIPLTVKVMPWIAVSGLLLYAASPILFADQVYIGLVLATIIFSAASGLAEVLISPVIAAIPSKDPDREMSKLHSIYAWGVVAVVIFATLFLLVFGQQSWQILALILMLVPLLSGILFSKVQLPQMETPEKVGKVFEFLKRPALWLCVAAIFLGGATECTMAQWCSGYIEQALGIPKVWGDLFGVALFAAMLGLGRTMYAKIGRQPSRAMLAGALGASACYLTAALCDLPLLGLLACGLTGFCASTLWPNSLVVASDRFPSGGVFIFAMMAAGGDLGASIGPQLIGVITDTVAANADMTVLAASMNLAPEQFGMKLGMLVGALFPILAIPVYSMIMKHRKEHLLKSKEN